MIIAVASTSHLVVADPDKRTNGTANATDKYQGGAIGGGFQRKPTKPRWLEKKKSY